MANLLRIILGVACFTTIPSFAAEYSSIRQYVHPVIVSKMGAMQITQTAVSSGSVITIANGYALTAAHVVPLVSSESIHVMNKDGAVRVTPIKIDRDRDLALLAGNLPCPCAQIALSNPIIDEPVYSVGYPLYMMYGVQVLTLGTMQGMYDKNIMTTAVSAPGGSGGGLFYKEASEFKLVGITIAVAATPMGPRVMNLEREHNWLSFSVSSTTIREFLKGSPVVIK